MGKFLKHRHTISKIYKTELNNFEFQEIPQYVSRHPFMLFAILTPKKTRENLNQFLNKNGIETRICWPPVHKQSFHSQIFKGKFPNSDEIFSKVLNLPMGNGLTEENAMYVIEIIKKWKT
jgi:dTDP-4-amino-4,6-dideoxygalactose transaminase